MGIAWDGDFDRCFLKEKTREVDAVYGKAREILFLLENLP
jgi:phosphomannomutase